MTEMIYGDNIDYNFVIQLAKIGSVHLLSNQVTVEGKCLDFKKVTIPTGVVMEWLGARTEGAGGVSATFRFPD